jgi:hypothetical protein
MKTFNLLGTGLLKEEKKINGLFKYSDKELKEKLRVRRSRKIEIFLREILGTRLIQKEKVSRV